MKTIVICINVLFYDFICCYKVKFLAIFAIYILLNIIFIGIIMWGFRLKIKIWTTPEVHHVKALASAKITELVNYYH